MERPEEYFPWKGSNSIFDSNERPKDLNNKKLNAYTGTYTVADDYVLKVLIKKGPQLRLESYDLLSNFRHTNAILLLDHYTEAGNQHRLVFPEVDGSFSAWCEMAGKAALFDEQGRMTHLLKNMAADLFDLVEQLHKVKLTLGNLDMDSIYVKNLDGSIKLLVLLTEVKLLEPGIQAMQDQNHVSEFINFCAERHSVAMDPITLGFSYFIKQEFCTSDKLRSYPDDWDDYRKGEFLMSLQNMHPRSLRELFKNVDGIGWPVKDKYLPKILSDIVEVDSLQGREHNLKDFSDYVNLLRNRYKHFNGLPDEVKAVLVNRKGLIKIISEWTPNFWIVVYERTGWPKTNLPGPLL